MRNYLIRFIRKVQIINNQRKLKFEFTIKDKIPRIKVQEKYEKVVRWILRLLTLIGIVSSIITFSKWYYSLSFSIGLFLLGQIFEKMIYTYTVMIVQPMPKNWNGAAWSMMIVGGFNNKYVLAFGFNEKDVAMDFFDTILYWNNNEFINDTNINISMVLEDENNYSVYVYPDIERDFVINSINKANKKFKYDKYGKEQTSLVTQITICKVFSNQCNSAFNILRNVHDSIYITIYDTHNYCEDKPETINTIRPFDDRKILCRNIKVLKRSELDKQKDVIEYFHVPKY